MHNTPHTQYSAGASHVLAGRDMAHAASTMQVRLHNLYQQVSNEAAASCSAPVKTCALEPPPGSAALVPEAIDPLRPLVSSALRSTVRNLLPSRRRRSSATVVSRCTRKGYCMPQALVLGL